MMAIWSMNLAILGRCSLTWMPATEVSMALNGPPLAWPGLGSNVSSWLGPPFIHRRMHDFRRLGSAAVSSASALSQPEYEQPTTPADTTFSQSRREKVIAMIRSPRLTTEAQRYREEKSRRMRH